MSQTASAERSARHPSGRHPSTRDELGILRRAVTPLLGESLQGAGGQQGHDSLGRAPSIHRVHG